MSRFIACLLIGLIPFVLDAQSIERKVIATAGTSVVVGNIQVDYTVGETVVQTSIAGNLIVTQGFQQGNLIATGVTGLPARVSYRVFPNPTTAEILVELEGPKLDYYAAIANLAGQALGDLEHHFNGTGKLQRTFDLSGMPAGVYLLVFKDHLGKPLTSVKVVKQ